MIQAHWTIMIRDSQGCPYFYASPPAAFLSGLFWTRKAVSIRWFDSPTEAERERDRLTKDFELKRERLSILTSEELEQVLIEQEIQG